MSGRCSRRGWRGSSVPRPDRGEGGSEEPSSPRPCRGQSHGRGARSASRVSGVSHRVLLVLRPGLRRWAQRCTLGDRTASETRRAARLGEGGAAVPLTEHQAAVALLSSSHRSEDSHLAGGAAPLAQQQEVQQRPRPLSGLGSSGGFGVRGRSRAARRAGLSGRDRDEPAWLHPSGRLQGRSEHQGRVGARLCLEAPAPRSGCESGLAPAPDRSRRRRGARLGGPR